VALLAGHCKQLLQPALAAGPPEEPLDWARPLPRRVFCCCGVCECLAAFMADPHESYQRYGPMR
jgi:hypothetical protein